MKIVKARKKHTCCYCGGIIQKGEFYRYEELREPDFDDNDDQCGVVYVKLRSHNRKCCDLLEHKPDYKNSLKYCTRGKHKFVEGYELDHYVDCHAVYAPTGEYFCEYCGERK